MLKKILGAGCSPLQVYQGLDTVTNKVTAAEQAAAKHHLLDFRPFCETFTARDFRNAALPIIAGKPLCVALRLHFNHHLMCIYPAASLFQTFMAVINFPSWLAAPTTTARACSFAI